MRNTFSYKSFMIGLGLFGLLALVVLLFVQAPSLTGAAGLEAGTGSTAVIVTEAPSGIHPADYKFFTNDYGSAERDTANAYLLAGVHPADRKFFTGAYETAILDGAGARTQAEAETADRKLQDPGYLEILMEQTTPDPAGGIHPADRKFFTNGYFWNAPAGETAVDAD